MEIRSKKFPDWQTTSTAGSFFKNPIIKKEAYEFLLETYPELPGYEVGTRNIKISLGWVLDKVCKLKGYRNEKVRLYEEQALVLVADKGVLAEEINSFANEIADLVFEKTKIKIEREVTSVY